MIHNKKATPFCRIVPSFCSPICCLIPGLSYGQDWWCTVKIILHRIISVVWLTNFPSEIRRLTSPRWWAVPLFPEREKVRGPAFGREPCIDDRLPLPCALAKEKMPAEWLLNSNLGLPRSSHMISSNVALWSLTGQITTGKPRKLQKAKGWRQGWTHQQQHRWWDCCRGRTKICQGMKEQ